MYSRPFPSRLYANDSFKENSREEFEAFVETLRRSCFVELENHKCQIFYSKDVTDYCGRNVNHEVNQVVSLCQEFFTNFGKRSFYYRGTVLWNSLPLRAVEAATLSTFKYLYFNS